MTLGSMQVGEVRTARQEDFAKFRLLADSLDGWTLQYDKQKTQVYSKLTEESSIKMIKVIACLDDVPIEVLYDVLHDPDYRKFWDENMIECYEICQLDSGNDIGYYSIKCPAPMKNRDFVTQRSWFYREGEFVIFNHTVHHKKAPVVKGFVRGVSKLTGYVVRMVDANSCVLTYVTQVDFKGILPKWVVNKAAQKIAPKAVLKLHKAALAYPEWKSKNQPDIKPWLRPEQNHLPVFIQDDVESVSGGSSDQEDENGVIKNDADYSSEDNLDGIML